MSFDTVREPIEQREYSEQCGSARLVLCRIGGATASQTNMTEIDVMQPSRPHQAQDNPNAPMATRIR
eukprot:9137083-Heterocapsa_arctica.AAC.1